MHGISFPLKESQYVGATEHHKYIYQNLNNFSIQTALFQINLFYILSFTLYTKISNTKHQWEVHVHYNILIMHGSIPPVTIPPPGHTPRDWPFFSFLGGLFLTPRHEGGDKSPAPGTRNKE